MLIQKEKLYQMLKNELVKHKDNINWKNIKQKIMFENHNYSTDITFGYLNGRDPIHAADDNLLFVLTEAIIPDKLSEIYTTKEIEIYSEYMLESKNIKFPIIIDAIEIKKDQYISGCDVSLLMKWDNAGLIKYNEKMQRPMKFVKDMFKQIVLNKKAVAEIKESYLNNTFIPNTITLNVPETGDYYYDSENKQLVITELDYVDIIDGYHRYVAIKQIFAQNPNWDYRMELRITGFSEEKGRNFIHQEDQKTKMSKVDSMSLNQESYGNKVVSYLDKGILTDFENIIDRPYLSICVDKAYFNTPKKTYKKSEVLEVRDRILKCSEVIIDNNPSMVDSRWTYTQIITMVCLSKYDIAVYDKFNDIVAKCPTLNKHFRVNHISAVEDIIKEVVKYEEQ